MSRAVSPVSDKPYGLAAVCRVWRFARSGVYRHQAPPPDTSPGRRGPMGPMSDAALTTEIRAVLAASPFYGEGHRKVWARLRHAGTPTSLRRVLRLCARTACWPPGASVLRAAHATTTAPSSPRRWTPCGAPT